MILTSLFLGMEIYKEKTRKNHYMNLIGLDIPKSSVVLKSEDSHGGFHGDGVLYEEIQLEGDDITIFVKNALNTNYWRKLPMDGDLKKLIYGEHGSNYSYGGSIFDRYSQNFNFALFDINKGKLYILKFDS